jgi:hypothetical protein
VSTPPPGGLRGVVAVITGGNLFSPVPELNRPRGGWRHGRPRPARLAALTAAGAAATAALAGLRR